MRTRSHAATVFRTDDRGQLCESTLKHDQQRAVKALLPVRIFGKLCTGILVPLSVPGQVYSQTNFKINFRGQGNAAFLGDAGNFAYAAVSANIGIPLFAVEAVAGG